MLRSPAFAWSRLLSSRRALAGDRRSKAVSFSASKSARDISTASPRFDVISIGSRFSFTCSMRGKRFFLASLAVIDMGIPPSRKSYHLWYHISRQQVGEKLYSETRFQLDLLLLCYSNFWTPRTVPLLSGLLEGRKA